jgi:hypothetical protein
MSYFTTKLSKVLDIVDTFINMDGFEVEDDMLEMQHHTSYLDPKDPRNHTKVVVDLSSYDNGETTFIDQDVVVNEDGEFEALNVEGDACRFQMWVRRPIKEADIPT